MPHNPQNDTATDPAPEAGTGTPPEGHDNTAVAQSDQSNGTDASADNDSAPETSDESDADESDESDDFDEEDEESELVATKTIKAKQNETFNEIAERVNVPAGQLAKLNPKVNVHMVLAGTEINIP